MAELLSKVWTPLQVGHYVTEISGRCRTSTRNLAAHVSEAISVVELPANVVDSALK